jgi:apolipoprotein N-acyltransferase
VASAAASSLDERVELLVVEPGFRPDAMFELPPSDWRAWSDRFVEERLVAPTRAGLEGADEIELVLWPESSVQAFVRERQLGAAGASLALPRLPSADARLLVGANVVRGARSTPAAVLVGLPDGAILGYQAKQQLVPGGEFLPLLGALPESWSGWLKEKFRAALGALPDCVAGEVRPPLRTARGAPFGALLCYDNAFLGPAAAQVEQGASFLVVLSNEAWYRGGGELQQLVAMTVVRACENAAPIVRCTMDGWTVWVDGEGRIAGGLPLDHAQPDGRARSMRVALTPGAGKPPLFGWLRYGSGPACGLLAVAGAALGWARRRRHRSPLR